MDENKQEETSSEPKSQKTMLMVGAGVLVLIVVGVILVSQGGSKTPEKTTTATNSPTTAGTETGSVTSGQAIPGDMQEVSVEGKEFSYTPSTMTLKKGTKVVVTFKNTGKMQHDFVVEELNVRTKVIGPGQTDTVEFTVPASGVLTYYCSVGTHRKLGMEGKITIE